MSSPRAKARKRQTGVVLAAVLVCIVVILMLGTVLTRSVTIWHRHVRVTDQRQQAFWIAESAAQRAIHALQQSREYQGETWKISSESLGGSAAGVAVIQVDRVTKPRAGWQVHVEARFPDAPQHRAMCRRNLFVESK